MTHERRPNFLSALHGKPRERSRLRVIRLVLWLGGVIAAAIVAITISDRLVRGISLVALLFLIVGGAIAWLAGRSGRLSSSGREMKDYIRPGNSGLS